MAGKRLVARAEDAFSGAWEDPCRRVYRAYIKAIFIYRADRVFTYRVYRVWLSRGSIGFMVLVLGLGL